MCPQTIFRVFVAFGKRSGFKLGEALRETRVQRSSSTPAEDRETLRRSTGEAGRDVAVMDLQLLKLTNTAEVAVTRGGELASVPLARLEASPT